MNPSPPSHSSLDSDVRSLWRAIRVSQRQFDGCQGIGQASAMKIKVIVERGEDGCCVAHCPALKICWSQGKTREEALENVREAMELFLD